MRHPVVVTGLGVVSPIGNDLDSFSRALFDGASGAAEVRNFDASRFPTRIAAEVKNFKSEFRDIKISFALQAAKEAMASAFLGSTDLSHERAGLSVGLGLELFEMTDLSTYFEKNGDTLSEDWMENLTFLNTPSDLCAHILSHQYQLRIPPRVHISACAASTDAIGDAFRAVSEDQVDIVLAGGADSMINPMGFGGFCRIGAMTQSNHLPLTASRPFDRKRDGFVLGEGAGFLVLEKESFARQRGAIILARISGYGNSLDAYSVSDPHPEGLHSALAMQKALNSAGLEPGDISAVNAHGTSTPKNDPAEARALQRVFGKYTETIPVSSTKSIIGHLIAAAGAVETVAMVQCIRACKLHPTANLKDVDEDCDLFHVMDKPREMSLKHILKNSFGFGGQNASIIISSYN